MYLCHSKMKFNMPFAQGQGEKCLKFHFPIHIDRTDFSNEKFSYASLKLNSIYWYMMYVIQKRTWLDSCEFFRLVIKNK